MNAFCSGYGLRNVHVKGVLAALAAILVIAVPASAARRYDDSPCRMAHVAWTNDACAGRQWGLARIAAPQAWRVTRGRGVRVAVVDTGADFRHPDLRVRLLAVRGSDLTRSNPPTAARGSTGGAGDDRELSPWTTTATAHTWPGSSRHAAATGSA